jgi:hypothetical protein
MRSIIAASVVDFPLPVVPGDQHQAARRHRDLLDHLGQAQVGELRDLQRDPPERQRQAVALIERVDPEPSGARHLEAEVGRAVLLQADLGLCGRHLLHVLADVRVFERRRFQRLEVAAQTHHRRRSGLQVEVAPTELHQSLQQSNQFHENLRSCPA